MNASSSAARVFRINHQRVHVDSFLQIDLYVLISHSKTFTTCVIILSFLVQQTTRKGQIIVLCTSNAVVCGKQSSKSADLR